MIVFECDNCKKTSENENEFICIGSDTGKVLRMKNKLSNAKLLEMNSHRDIHFCSKKCLCDYLFKPEPIFSLTEIEKAYLLAAPVNSPLYKNFINNLKKTHKE